MSSKPAAWRGKLRQASFRGVVFAIEGSERGTGQRSAKHEFAGRNGGYNEPLGRKLRDDTIQAFVLGDDYMSARDALITACEADGPGILVHPFYGSVNVICTGCRISENKDTGGKASFALTFEEAGSLVYPAATSDVSSGVSAASLGAIAAAQTAFANAFKTGLTGSALTSAQNLVTSVTDQVQGAVNLAKASYQSTAAVAFQLKAMQDQIVTAMNSPALIAQILTNAMATFNGLGISSSQVRDTFIGMSSFGAALNPISGTSKNKQIMAANQAAIVGLVQQVAIANAVAATIAAPGASVQESISIRDELSDSIDAQLDTVSDDNLYFSLTELQTQLVLSLPPPGQTLGDVITISPIQTTCSLVFLYEQFGSIDQEDDFLTRNDISNPAFLSPGVAYEVLQDGST